jgi:hypothetical protein
VRLLHVERTLQNVTVATRQDGSVLLEPAASVTLTS